MKKHKRRRRSAVHRNTWLALGMGTVAGWAILVWLDKQAAPQPG